MDRICIVLFKTSAKRVTIHSLVEASYICSHSCPGADRSEAVILRHQPLWPTPVGKVGEVSCPGSQQNVPCRSRNWSHNFWIAGRQLYYWAKAALHNNSENLYIITHMMFPKKFLKRALCITRRVGGATVYDSSKKHRNHFCLFHLYLLLLAFGADHCWYVDVSLKANFVRRDDGWEGRANKCKRKVWWNYPEVLIVEMRLISEILPPSKTPP